MKAPIHVTRSAVSVLLLLVSVVCYAQSSTIEVQGEIIQDTIWSADTVKVTGDLTVQDSIILTIEPGTYVEFQGPYTIRVYGTLLAIGTDTDSIVFTIHDTTGFHHIDSEEGGWDGLEFNNSPYWGSPGDLMDDNDSSVIDHCIFEYSKFVRHNGMDGGAVRLANFGRLRITNSLFRNNLTRTWGGGICFLFDSDALVRGNRFENNYASAGGAIGVQAASPTIENNYIGYNKSIPDYLYPDVEERGGGIMCNVGQMVIRNNIIEFNESGSGGGICLWGTDAMICGNTIAFNSAGGDEAVGGGIFFSLGDRSVILKNIIANNSSMTGGGIMAHNSDIEIYSNLIANNSAGREGGGIYLEDSDAEITNNTIINNEALQIAGGINVVESSPVFRNCMIWGNTASEGNQYYQCDGFSLTEFYYCNIEGGLSGFDGREFHGIYENNITLEPGLANPTTLTGLAHDATLADFSLSDQSSCINSGTPDMSPYQLPDKDLSGNPRINHSYIDIGAYEAHIPSISVSDTIRNDTTWIADTIFVAGDVVILDSACLSITPGARVVCTGHYEISVQGVLLAVGTRTDTIQFTVDDTTGLSNIETPEGGWRGIFFDNGIDGADGAMYDNDTSKLIYCRIEYGNSLDSLRDNCAGAVYVNHFDRLLIENSEISFNQAASLGGALFCNKSDPVIRNNYIHHNKASGGGGIYCHAADPLIEKNLISHNVSVAGGGAGIHCSQSEPLILNNTIWKNVASANGGGINCNASDARIINNLLLNNSAYNGGGIYISWGPAEVTNNLIANNEVQTSGAGIAIFISENVILVNNTIVNNLAYGGGGIAGVVSSIHCHNSILWGNYSEFGRQASIGSSASTINFSNCNIEEGLSGLLNRSGGEWSGNYLNNIDTIPDFMSPTENFGAGIDALSGDWSLHPTSYCINTGKTDIPLSHNLPGKDLSGNNRIFNSLIDIGCYENQSGPPEITQQPVNHILCRGDSVTFRTETREKSNYQWQKDETDIPGANRAAFTIDSVTAADDGNYHCVISNMHETVVSNSAYLLVKDPARVLVEPGISWIRKDESFILRMIPNGSMPFTYQWQKDGNDIPDANSPEYVISSAGFEHEGEYQCIISNYCDSDTTSPASVFVAPQICMVTVSPTTGYNLIVWEKNSIAPVTGYNIYRESVAAGIYDKLATVPYDELSVFTDTAADPTVQAYLYKITAVDTGHIETDIDLCKPHKTIHLIVSTNPELMTTQLQWDRYYGFDYNTYTIYKSSTGMNFDPVHSMSASLNSWTDPNPITGDLFYRIAVEKPYPCLPAGIDKKASSGPFVHSLSNMDDNKLKEGQLSPDSIILDNFWIHESTQPGTVIGKLLTFDPDSLDSHTYKFVTGDGDEDNLSFTIMGDLLLSSVSFNYASQQLYKIRIRSTDEAGNYCEIPFLLNIIPTANKYPEQEKIQIYPNPVQQYATVIYPNPDNKSCRMVITDLSGKVVYFRENINKERFNLRNPGLEKGIYLLEIKGNKTYRTRIMFE